jgi:glycine cleavage system H protein
MAAAAPANLCYLSTHEWHRRDGDVVTIGITQFAADELTDITYVGYKVKPGDKISANGRFGEIESVKTASDLYSGVAGTVAEVNKELDSNPTLVNSDPYNKGWMIKVRVANPADLDKLLSADEYTKKTGH